MSRRDPAPRVRPVADKRVKYGERLGASEAVELAAIGLEAEFTVLLDGKPVGDARGADVGSDGVARFDGPRMIRLVAGAERRRHVLTVVASDPGVRAFAFTFGP